MDSLKFCNVRVEKANAISKYVKIQRITAVFRFLELFVFTIIVVRFCSHFPFSVKSPGEHFRGFLLTLISPRFVFLIGNLIVAVLLLNSGRFSAGKGTDFYDEYVEKCRRNHPTSGKGKPRDVEVMNRSASEKVLRVAQVEERRRELRRSMTERCQRSATNASSGRKNAAAANGGITSYCAEDEMSGEEFRQAVEAFIARQQRLLREEEALSDV
ncbi:uncharacterized protein [Henckelia pumila]|uniref:uncharacterized protein n=1 Tax=Henckelia pumila TaxID=405737 RepID=UPI003C6DDB08